MNRSGRSPRGAAMEGEEELTCWRLRLGRLLLPVALAMAGGCGDAGSDGPDLVFRLGISEPTAIDPYNVQESEGFVVALQLYEGLVRIDEQTSRLTPGVATTWEKTGDCGQWTFHLANNSVFSNGEAVTAESFIRGWTRTADGRSASDVAYHMAGIDGFAALHGTEDKPEPTARTFSGLSAPDPHTLVVRLSSPDCEFDKKTLLIAFSPVPQSVGAANNKAFNDQPIGNGPYKMKGPWKHDKNITLVRNDRYRGDRPQIDQVEISIVSAEEGVDLQYRNFRAGRFDYARVPGALVPEARDTYANRGGFVAQPANVIIYLSPTINSPPFNSVDARKAISFAIDRQAVMEGVHKGLQPAASSLIPPSFNAVYQPRVCTACSFNAAKAKEHATRAGLNPGTRIKFSYPTGQDQEPEVEAVARQLEVNLGLRVELVPLPFKEFLQEARSPGASGLFVSGWFADYPTPDNFLYPLLSSHSLPPGDNFSRYENPAFDALLDQARAASSESERLRLYREAERLAIGEDLAAIPIRYSTEYRVFNAEKWANVKLGFFVTPDFSAIRFR